MGLKIVGFVGFYPAEPNFLALALVSSHENTHNRDPLSRSIIKIPN
jgi:hypothetical protein